MLSLSWPGPFEILFLLMLLAVPAVLVLLVLRGKRAARPERPAFPVIPAADADGPGAYRVTGVDTATRADRELTVDAASRANAQVKAELEGVIVTAVQKKT
jgi:hypothetical protein